jgi:hypothetical protein
MGGVAQHCVPDFRRIFFEIHLPFSSDLPVNMPTFCNFSRKVPATLAKEVTFTLENRNN